MKKEIKKAMGVSPVTGRIYYGNLRGDEWIGGKEDVTETAVRAVFEWFVEKFEDVCPADGQYTLEFLDEEYALTMKRKSFEYPARWKNRQNITITSTPNALSADSRSRVSKRLKRVDAAQNTRR